MIDLKKYSGDVETILLVFLCFMLFWKPPTQLATFFHYLVCIGIVLFLLVIPTQNDAYRKITALLLGSMLIIGVLGFCIWRHSINPFSIILLCLGIHRVASGVLALPGEKLELNTYELRIPGISKTFDVRLIRQMIFHPDHIVFINTFDEKNFLRGLKLDHTNVEQVIAYLSQSTHGIEFVDSTRKSDFVN